MKPRLRTYVVWYCNHVNRKDDEWEEVKAHSPEEAKTKLKRFDPHRFSLGHIYTLSEFRKVVK
jgi:hypothetical protein